MTWTAVIPLKGRGEHKTRLASRLDAEQRRALSQKLFAHVAEVLRSSPGVGEVALLSNSRPESWEGRLILDHGRGLNAELGSLAETSRPLLVIHADLPFVSTDDIAALLAGAESGCAIAPDRHGEGTNAIALRDPAGFEFCFGKNSFEHHLATTLQARVVKCPGLGLDVDTPEDLDAALALGLALN